MGLFPNLNHPRIYVESVQPAGESRSQVRSVCLPMKTEVDQVNWTTGQASVQHLNQGQPILHGFQVAINLFFSNPGSRRPTRCRGYQSRY